MNEIPLIDFQNFLTGNSVQKKLVADELTNAIKTYGFAYLKNYGISQEKVQQMFESSKKFFDSDLAVKKLAAKDLTSYCGYDEVETEKLSKDRPADLKESFMFKKIGTPWPNANALPGFKETMLDYHAYCYSLASNLTKAISVGLDLNENAIFTESKFNGECTVLRIHHYPPLSKPPLPNQLRCGEHSDYGCVSVLFQDPAGGLQIKTKKGDWIPAPYIPDTAIMNIGNVMEMWTNGYLNSTPHRVVVPDGGENKSRYSTAFFFDPNLDTELKCLSEFKDVNNTKLNDKTYGEHVTKLFKLTYPDSKFDFDKELQEKQKNWK